MRNISIEITFAEMTSSTGDLHGELVISRVGSTNFVKIVSN
uniref:Uncharacterized protein n=1 Tax=viral metagenome TaxID=1070528 RepID=A0A6C0I950_9ZZZZ